MIVTEFSGDHAFLSNFFLADIGFSGAKGHIMFPSNEHAFQAAKHRYMDAPVKERQEWVIKVAKATTPSLAKKMGREVDIDLKAWETDRVKVMREVCWEKFDQHPALRARLLETDGMLVEGNTWGDVFWGRCKGRGANYLGAILMEIRGYYRWSE